MNKNRKTRGYTLLIVLMILPLIAIAGFGMLNAVETETLLARHDVMKFRAELLEPPVARRRRDGGRTLSVRDYRK